MSLTIEELNQRSLDIFRSLVESYVETGEPVGSRTLSKRLGSSLSPATIRNIMADLEDAGLLYAPHTSAGRLPTEEGFRFFVHGLLEVGDISEENRRKIEEHILSHGQTLDVVLSEATRLLSGLSSCTSVITAPKADTPLKHVEFVQVNADHALVILISEDGLVENRLMHIPKGVHSSTLTQAGRYMSSCLKGKTLDDARAFMEEDLSQHRAHLDELTTKVVEQGLAVWAGGEAGGSLIIKGQSHLLDQVTDLNDLESLRALFRQLETKEAVSQLVNASIHADGIQIFIGSQSRLFELAGCSMVVAPYRNSNQTIVGAMGVIGPTRMDYGRIIPLVDYTAKMVGRLIGVTM